MNRRNSIAASVVDEIEAESKERSIWILIDQLLLLFIVSLINKSTPIALTLLLREWDTNGAMCEICK